MAFPYSLFHQLLSHFFFISIVMKLPIIIIIGIVCLFSGIISAQVGVGTSTPDSSAILDLTSTDKGLLIPRMNESQRDLINHPAEGLMIYNTTTSSIQVNTGTSEVPEWTVPGSNIENTILSVVGHEELMTTSTTSELIEGMTISPEPGTYLVMFNAQYEIVPSQPISTEQGVIDLNAAYAALMAIPATNTIHGAVFGNGETLLPGVYTVPAAASTAGTLTMDGLGNPNAVFVIRIGAAFSTGAASTIVLTGGAQSSHIFWVAEGAISLGANTTMKGTLISHNAAVSAAAGSDITGRMFSTSGAMSFGPGTATIPDGESYIDLGVLSSFVIFTSLGAVSNTDPSIITGDVGSNGGLISGFSMLNGNIYGPGAPPVPEEPLSVTFSVFQNGILAAHSERTTNDQSTLISLQATATITGNPTIDIRWYVESGEARIYKRILTLVKLL
jgi:hypothetical protein